MSSATYDAIIIGAGSVGAPAAFFLTKAGLKVLVIDKFSSAGQGSNKAAIGGIRATHSDPAKIKICLKSIEIFSTWEEQFGDNIEWNSGGYSFMAYREREENILKELLITQHEYGLNIDWLDRDAMLDLVPALNPVGLLGGTFSPEDGSASPVRSVLAFHRQAVNRGASFAFNEKVTGFLVNKDRVNGVRTDKGTYHAKWVVNAAGPWAHEVAEMAGLDTPVVPESHEGGVTEPVAEFLRPMLVDIHPTVDSLNYYFYQHATGQIVFCITPSPPLIGTDRRETSLFLPQVCKRMVNLVPRLRFLKIRRTWRGLYPMTPDGFPIVGQAPDLEGYIHAVGMCGQGYMLGPGLGPLLVRIIQDDLSPEDNEVLWSLCPNRSFHGQEKLK